MNLRHGHYRGRKATATYRSWVAMIGRCYRPNDVKYATYGAVGVTVCDRWRDFRNFLADMGERPAGKTLDRLDNGKGYGPNNCRWATKLQQSKNSRRIKVLELHGECHHIAEWARLHGMHPRLLYSRLERGVSLERALGA